MITPEDESRNSPADAPPLKEGPTASCGASASDGSSAADRQTSVSVPALASQSQGDEWAAPSIDPTTASPDLPPPWDTIWKDRKRRKIPQDDRVIAWMARKFNSLHERLLPHGYRLQGLPGQLGVQVIARADGVVVPGSDQWLWLYLEHGGKPADALHFIRLADLPPANP